MPENLAINDRKAVFSHVAFVWCDETQSWRFLCAGASDEEFQSRLAYWISKGTDSEAVKVYETKVMELSE